MAFSDCIIKALKAGRITQKMYKGLEDHLKANGIDFDKSDFSTPEEQRVLDEAIRNVDETMALKKKQLVLAVQARERNEAAIVMKGGKRPVDTLINSLQDVENRASTIRQQWAAPIADFFQKYAKGNFLGNFLRNELDRDKFGREMMNPGSSKSGLHAQLAQAIQKVQDMTVVRRADAGMDIKPLAHYGLTTNHDGIAIGKAGFKTWAKAAQQTFATIGGKPLASFGKDLPAVLKEIFDHTISSHAGLGASDPINEHRVIGFGDYDRWKAYNKDYGMSAGDPVNAVQGHMMHASNQAAMLEQFGPAPNAMVRHMRDFAFDQAKENNSYTAQAQRDLKKFDGIYRAMTEPDSPLSWAGATYSGFRSAVYGRIAQIAYLSQLPVDLLSRVPTLKMINNLPASSMVHMLTRYLPTLGGDEARQMAIRAGVGGDNLWSELLKGNDQILREHPIMGRVMSVNDPLARAFFVHAHMESLPRMMGMDFLSNFARWKDMDFSALPIRESMERAGITKSDWDVFRKTEVADNNGMKMLQPVDMLKRDDLPAQQLRDIATRIGMYVNGEARETIPAPNLRNRYGLVGNFDPNSVAGMIVKDMTVALSFTASTAMMLARGFMLRQGVMSKIGFAGAAGTALLGANALRMQMKAIAAGRDPYNMNPSDKDGRAFWVQNLKTCGFAGPSLELMNPTHAGSVSSTVGKTVEAAYEGIKYQAGDSQKNPHTAGKLFKLSEDFVPGASGWWSHLLVQHGALDNIHREIDPNAQEEWNRTNKYYQTNFGQQPFWKQGEALPSRAPDFSKAFNQ